jgi:hypothetical protein
MDADSLIDPDALLQAFRVMLADDGVAVVGGRVALANGCEIREGHVERTGLSNSSLARFQVVEYVRSFSLGRTALGVLDAILIISGVFGIFRKEAVLGVGGYLTRFLTGKIALEYTGEGRATVRTWRSSSGSAIHPGKRLRQSRLHPAPLLDGGPEDARSSGNSGTGGPAAWRKRLLPRALLFSRRHGRMS